jgi:hypothetical protein
MGTTWSFIQGSVYQESGVIFILRTLTKGRVAMSDPALEFDRLKCWSGEGLDRFVAIEDHAGFAVP